MTRYSRHAGFVFVVIFVVLHAPILSAADRQWSGGGGTADWFDAANWSPFDSYPVAGENVLLDGGASVVLSNSTALLGNVVVTNASLLFTNWTTTLRAADVTLLKDGTFALPPPFTEAQMSNRVNVVCSSFVMETGAAIEADGKGFYVAQGPGKGDESGSNQNGGGGYGGRGGDENTGHGGEPYGSASAPVAAGSGGGQYLDRTGGSGGGAVRIVATNVTLNGTITANGETGSSYNGGGSGGGVLIECSRFAATGGVISVNGGNGGASYGGGGAGGGRIALLYDTLAGLPSVRFSARAGALYHREAPGMGTLYVSDGSLLVANGFAQRFNHVRVLGGYSAVSVDSLLVTNAVSLGEEGVTLTVSNDLTISHGGWLTLGAAALSDGVAFGTTGQATNPVVRVGGGLTLDDGGLTLGGLGHGSVVDASVGGALVVTNGAALTVYGGATTDVAEAGALLTVGGATHIGVGCWVCAHSHPTNGGSAVFRLQDLTVEAGAGFCADAAGYQSDGILVYGPGAGVSAGSRGGGGGYGGVGGTGNNASSFGGGTYGRTNAPVQPGSAGGYGHSPAPGYGHGGGLIRIEAGDVMLDGALTAGGTDCVSSYGGGGAGGGIFLMCDTLTGGSSGLLSVDGGDGGVSLGDYLGGGGGGGRIAVAIGLSAADRARLLAGQEVMNLVAYAEHGDFQGDMTATNGAGYTSATPARPGTARFLAVASGGTFSLGVQGSPGEHDSPSPNDYGTHVGIPENTELTNTVTTPTDTANGQRWVALGWDLVDEGGGPVSNGTAPQAVFPVTTNLTLTWRWTNQFELAVSSATPSNGSVNATSVNGWYTNGVAATGILATASNGYIFSVWSGAVPAGHETDNPLSVAMDQMRNIVAAFASIAGGTKRWNGNGSWDEGSNWSPSGAPGPFDTAIIESGTTVLSAPRQVASVVVTNGATILFTNWTAQLTADAASVLSGGSLTLPTAFAEAQMSNRVHVVCSNFVLEAGASIDADGKGFTIAQGPGKGDESGSNNNGGGGYGGRGGDEGNGHGGAPYGSADAPMAPGSGGGQYLSNAGGSGGGAVWIAATNVTINGTISANGETGSSYNGGGSGGGVLIECSRFAATGGVISVNGGNGGASHGGGGGGGGRIALLYETLEGLPSVRCSARAGALYHREAPGMGTLYVSDGSLLVANGFAQRFDHVRVLGAYSAVSVDSLLVTNAVSLGEEAMTLTVTNDLTISHGGWLTLGAVALSDGVAFGTSGPATNPVVRIGGGLMVDDGTLTLGGLGHGSVVDARVDGVLTLTNGATVTVYSGATTDVAEAGASLTVGGSTCVRTGCWVYVYSHPTNGGSVVFDLQDLGVENGAGFVADGAGFQSDGLLVYGPGAGLSVGSRGGGGGYGGIGGRGDNASSFGGGAYGATNMAVQPGSAGGYGYAATPGYGHGGGLIRIAAGDVTLDGALTAGGANCVSSYGGGGAGGGVFLICDRLTGGSSGLLSANGGDGGSHGGGGAGGRIAAWVGLPPEMRDQLLANPYNPTVMGQMVVSNGYEHYEGVAEVDGGSGYQDGGAGTVVFLTPIIPAGTFFIMR